MPPGLQVATTGSRVGAWLLDRAFFFFLAVSLAAIALVVGAAAISPAANDQMLAGKSANLVTVPLLTVNPNLLVVFGALWVVIQYAYEALSWNRFRGTPGQRILSLRVVDPSMKRNLTIWQSTLRWFVLESVPQVALTIFLVLFVQMMGEVPPSVYGAGAANGSLPTNSTYATVSLVGDLAFLLSFGWRLALLFMTTTHRTKRGLHDRISGSVVLGRAPLASYSAQSGYSVGPETAPPGQWSAPAPGIWSPPGVPVGPPTGIGPALAGGQPVPSEEAEPGGEHQPGRPPEPTQPVGRSRNPKSTWPPSEDSMPLAHRLADGTDLPAGLRVPAIPRRLGAYVIDCLIVYFFFSAWLGALGYAGAEKQAILAGVIAGLGQLVYFVACWRLFRGTVGLRVLKLQIGNVQTGEALAWGDAFVRWCILQGPFALVTVVPVVLYPAVLFGAAGWSAFLLYDAYYKPDHRAVHDRAVHSLVAQTVATGR